ncbi:hypothetical protein Ocin01_10010 [Orchesella cincta]|uniref:Uncharacterized protein n=1 Tax=Orchesella cincta TaxID=48709 RepID=A0A1D2MUA5_ORCCI|nr:hypothetical protein Ocin01_10010 [Orchesella cincta]
MLKKFIPVLLMVIGIIALVSTEEDVDPCDGKPYEEATNCTENIGKFVLDHSLCTKVMVYYNGPTGNEYTA